MPPRKRRRCRGWGCERVVQWTRCKDHQPARQPLERWLDEFWAEPIPDETLRQLARRDTAYLLDQFINRNGPAYDRYDALFGEHLDYDS